MSRVLSHISHEEVFDFGVFKNAKHIIPHHPFDKGYGLSRSVFKPDFAPSVDWKR
jgi:hypothetical protein